TRAARAIVALGMDARVVDAALRAGPGVLSSVALARLLAASPRSEELLAEVLARADDPAQVELATQLLPRTSRAHALRVVAGIFAEGARASLRLLGRRVRISMRAGALGYARLE